jgi:transcriptional regulator with XRE-family HTH domain
MNESMEHKMTHWTERSIDDFLYRIAADFAGQLEKRIQSEPLSKAKLAEKLGVSKGRVSQILNNPGNLTLRMIIKCARAIGLKVAIVAYDDNDQKNERGPVNSEIFRLCWENSGKPLDFWSMEKPQCVAISTSAPIEYHVIGSSLLYYQCQTSTSQTSLTTLPLSIDRQLDEMAIPPFVGAKKLIEERGVING